MEFLLPLIFGYSLLFWLLIGVIRFLTEEVGRLVARRKYSPGFRWIKPPKIPRHKVAVIMAAHNEEIALPETLGALIKNLPPQNIYIGSDASTDRTVEIAKAHGCNVLDIRPNRGKSRVLAHLLEHYRILERYEAVIILDAEIIVGDNYLETILPYFDDPDLAVFVSHAVSRWRKHWLPTWSMFFAAYRIQLWRMLYYGLRYGQTWKYLYATPIIPGGSSVWRSSVLAQIEIDTPGFIIEDYHMTFQVYHKKLGRVTSHPAAWILDQEPYSLYDYCRQVHRWFLGFWQTLLYHGAWPSFFWVSTMSFTLEMIVYSLFMILVPFILLAMLVYQNVSLPLWYITFQPLGFTTIPIAMSEVLISVFLISYLMTVIVAIIEKKPVMLIYGPGFFFLRFIDTIIFLVTLPEALMATSATGSWKSPARKAAI